MLSLLYGRQRRPTLWLGGEMCDVRRHRGSRFPSRAAPEGPTLAAIVGTVFAGPRALARLDARVERVALREMGQPRRGIVCPQLAQGTWALPQIGSRISCRAHRSSTSGLPGPKGGRPRPPAPYTKDTFGDDFGVARAAEFPGDKRKIMDFRRSGSVEAIAGEAPPAVLAAKMANTIDQNKAAGDLFAAPGRRCPARRCSAGSGAQPVAGREQISPEKLKRKLQKAETQVEK
jgi:hypothetical protein